MNIAFDFEGISVSAVLHHDRHFGYMVADLRASMNGIDLTPNFAEHYILRLESAARDYAAKRKDSGW